VFYVNWFRKGDDGTFLWPGFGENSRVLEWVVRRCEGSAGAAETPIGLIPRPEDLDTERLDIAPEALEELLAFDAESVRAELPQVREHLARFGDNLPAAVRAQFDALERALSPDPSAGARRAAGARDASRLRWRHD
jgi:phosphoenolpyruvate carboxykinase (GTP)